MIDVVAGVARRDGQFLICRRRADRDEPLAWEFPGGKIEAGESPEQALARELREELGAAVRVGRILDAIYQKRADKELLILFYAVELCAGGLRALDNSGFAWVAPEGLNAYRFAPADALFLERQGL